MNSSHHKQDQPLISLKNLSTGYPGKCLLSNATADVAEGELVTLIGANGAGKSTLLKTLCGELLPLGGSAAICGFDVTHGNKANMARFLSVVNTTRVEVENLTVEELTAMGRYPYTGFFGRLGRDDRRIVSRSLDSVGMLGYAGRKVDSLSDGERQKVMVARAIAQATPVIILDEPTAFLDAAARIELNTLLANLAHDRHKAILLTSHDISQAMEQSTRIWLLPTPRQGEPSRLLTSTPAGLLESFNRDGALSPLGQLFAGREVEFDPKRLDFRPA